MQEQNKFRYIYNGKEVNKEEFEKLSEGSFKWFSKQGIESVPFSSFDSFFNGEYRSGRQINDHLDSVLNVYQNKVTEDIINKPKCSPQCYCDGSCKKPQEKNTNSTRHKSQAGETHTENLLYVKEGTGYDYLKRMMKDDVITNSSRGEKETMEYLQGVKEVLPSHNLYDNSNYWKHSLENWTDRLVGVKESQTTEKAPIFTYCKVNKNALEALSLRALYGHIKYKETDSDWQNFTRVPNALEEYANAEFRHALGIGEEDEETHLVASAWNAVAKLEVFLRNKLNKS